MYLALYRKWRPKLFSEVISQEHVTTTLKNEVKLKKIAHAYLFTGPKGTGKTSCARIFSRAVNCLNPVDGEPCCECNICKGIDDGTILDVVEMDGASNNSVNDVKILKDEATFVPAYCKFKIYIIDEVHMLSISAFNALLKIMEDPPKYVVFILATTEVGKVLPTIVSRCQRFDFRRVNSSDMENRLFQICNKENISLQKEAARRIVLMADGSVRDAVSLLDECSVVSSEISLKLIDEVFGFAKEVQVLELFKAVSCCDCAGAVKVVDETYNNGKDVQILCFDLISFCREILVCKVSEHTLDCSLFSESVFNEISKFASSLSLELIVNVLDECLKCFEDLKVFLHKKLKFELFILNLCFKFKNWSVSTLPKKKQHNVFSKPEVVEGSDENSNEKLKVENSVNLNNEGDLGRLERFQGWFEILNELKLSLKSEMLSGFLADSEAFVSGDRLYINFKNPIVSKKVLEHKQDIAAIIKQHTGRSYRIFVKKAGNTSEGFSDNGKLDRFLSVAKDLKIDIDKN